MARKKDPTAVPIKQFLGGYASAVAAGHASDKRSRANNFIDRVLRDDYEREPVTITSSAQLWDEVEDWWPVRLLRKAATEKDSESFRRLLHYWLSGLGVRVPKDALPLRGSPGRTLKPETLRIYQCWVEIGKPPINGNKLARQVFGPAFFKMALEERKLRIDLCRQAVKRVETRLNLEGIQSGKR
jgi:hypothetical protein